MFTSRYFSLILKLGKPHIQLCQNTKNVNLTIELNWILARSFKTTNLEPSINDILHFNKPFAPFLRQTKTHFRFRQEGNFLVKNKDKINYVMSRKAVSLRHNLALMSLMERMVIVSIEFVSCDKNRLQARSFCFPSQTVVRSFLVV